MTGTQLVKSGNDLVQQATGEVVGSVAEFSMSDYLTTITAKASLDQQQRLAAAYDAACNSLIGPNDVQVEGGRTFKKKSAWRKLQRHFGISTSVVRVEKELIGETFCSTVTVRAAAPWGQFAEAIGACATDEESGRRKITVADSIATAETRATNRAVSNLIAMGEVSAEEMSKSAKGSDKPAGEKIMPFGKDKGKKLSDMDDLALESTIDWCQSRGKFADLVQACTDVLNDRAQANNGVNQDDEEPY